MLYELSDLVLHAQLTIQQMRFNPPYRSPTYFKERNNIQVVLSGMRHEPVGERGR